MGPLPGRHENNHQGPQECAPAEPIHEGKDAKEAQQEIAVETSAMFG